MEASFWIKSWQLGGFYTSFHRKDIHPFILEHMTPEVLKDKTILVPLCGKTVDMMYMAQYAKKVIGVEIAEDAIHQFFTENGLEVSRPDDTTYVSGNIMLLCRSFMELQPTDIGEVDWILDRASLVALPYDMRLDYLNAIDRLSGPNTQQLVITLEYFPHLPSAPFSINPSEVDAYYSRRYKIKHVENCNQPNHGMVRRWNLDYLIEHGFVLTQQCA
jgi:thiopurine S-methyltransferase